jgi:glycosyltransferase involved in cell wall biosynthesis
MGELPGGIRAALDAQAAMPRRILWVTGTYFPDIGGAEWSAFASISLLKRSYGQCVVAATGHGTRVLDGIPVLEAQGKADLRRMVAHFRPQFVAVQGLLSSHAMSVALDTGCVVVYFIRAKTSLDFSTLVDEKRFRAVANSQWIGAWFNEAWGIRPIILHPPVLPWLVVSTYCTPRYVTHVGDIQVKGGGRVARIAAHLPDVEFLVTRSWPALRNGDGWSQERITQLQAGDGAETTFEPRIADFSELPNVTVRWPYLWPKALFAQTEILLVASKWREPYGRIVVEGLLNKLPIVVSPEANNERWSDLVYHVDDGDDSQAWVECIRRIRHEGHDPAKAAAIREFAETFDTQEAGNTLREVFRGP